VQAGLRNIHRDTKGNVIGAVTPEGRRIGTRNQGGVETGGWRGRSATPRLDAGPQTPGLDSNPSNLQQRQTLFADMKQAGAGGLTPEMSQRAKQLGVDQAGWRRGVAKLPPAPAALTASPAPAAAPAAPVMGITRAAAPMAPVVAPSAPSTPSVAPRSPLVEQAMAARDIGKMLAARKSAESATPVVPVPSFAVPPVASPLPVSAAPSAPVASFQSLTTPPAAIPAVPIAPASAAAVPAAQALRRSSRSVPKLDQPGASAAARFKEREKQVQDQRKIKRTAYNKVWNSQPDLPLLAPDSGANLVQKSLRTFFSGHSY